jgi:GNAT superfamily N-acetyltransferase
MKKNEKLDAAGTVLEYALEKFPAALKLRDGTPVVIRPYCRQDEIRLHQFLLAVPEEERLFIKQRISERAKFREWCRHPDFVENLPLLMLHGAKIIGEATLRQRPGGWKRHIGVLTMLTHPDYRGRDVARILIAEQVEIARALGLRKLESELNGERKIAIRALEDIGFHHLMRWTDYVLDMNAVPHDYVLMGLDLRVNEEYAGVGE